MRLKNYYTLCISILICNFGALVSLQAQSFADKLFAEEHYVDAAAEYQREMFFSGENQSISMLNVANCYAAVDNYTASKYFFELSYSNAIVDSVKAEAIIGLSLLNLLQNNSILALGNVLDLPENALPRQKRFAALIEAISYIHLNILDEAEKAMAKSYGNSPTDSLTAIQIIEQIKRLDKRYSPKRAFYLSIFAPGAGQLQARNTFAALNSASLVGLLFYLTTKIMIQYSIIDAFATMYPWLYRYYLGGANKAETLNLEKIKSERSKLLFNELNRFQ